MLCQSALQFGDGAAGFDGDGQIGPGMFDHAVQVHSGEHHVGAPRWIPPIRLRAAAARDDAGAVFVGGAQDLGGFFL